MHPKEVCYDAPVFISTSIYRAGVPLFSKCLNKVLVISLALIGLTASAQNHGSSKLETVLGQLDSQAKNFHSFSADVDRTKVTVVVNDRSTETGSILVRGDKMLLQMKSPDVRTVLLTGDNLYLYTPSLNR